MSFRVAALLLGLTGGSILESVTRSGRVVASEPPQECPQLGTGTVLENTLGPAQSHSYSLRLVAGGSMEVVVLQKGIDLVIELRDPVGKLLASFDSPNGRDGDEVVEFVAAREAVYTLHVRPIDEGQPGGQYRLEVIHLRNAAETRQMVAQRRTARESAAGWLRERSFPLGSGVELLSHGSREPLDRLASRVRVLGIGEATHGSREFGDLRLAMTRYLVEAHGYRVVAVEGSASRLGLLAPYVAADADHDADVTRRIESGWIGRRSQREIIEWLRAWNRAHPRDQVRLIGVDAQDNAEARDSLREFLAQAYGERLLVRWAEIEPDLIEGDAQAMVFGDSGAARPTRELLAEIVAMLELDAPWLRARHGTKAHAFARSTAQQLLQAVDFNSGGVGAITHSRDWYMALNVLAALEGSDAEMRAVLWSHNAHIAHPTGPARTSGAVLREVLGCGYGALALTFGDGAFVAQIPGDPQSRLAVSQLPHSPEDTVEGVLAQVHPSGALATWPCDAEADLPEWLARPRPMHWVGALWRPGTSPAEAFRPFWLTSDFDGIAYLRRVGADDLFDDRPLVPPRERVPQ